MIISKKNSNREGKTTTKLTIDAFNRKFKEHKNISFGGVQYMRSLAAEIVI